MEFLVHTSGEVSSFHNKTYVVKARSEEEAQKIAKQNFKNEFDCKKIHTEARSYARTGRAIAAAALMLIAIVISFFDYPYEDTILFFISTERTFSFAPSMQSCIFAIIFYISYVIRFKGILRSVSTFTDVAFCVLSVLLLSSVFELILTTDNLKFLWLIRLPDPYIVLVITIITSLFGVKLLSALSMAFIAITAVSNILVANEAMKFVGVIYVLCAFVGILLYLSIEPAVLEAFPMIQSSFSRMFRRTKKDFSDARSEADAIISSFNDSKKPIEDNK